MRGMVVDGYKSLNWWSEFCFFGNVFKDDIFESYLK